MRMSHKPKNNKRATQVQEPQAVNVLPKNIEDYSSIADFLAGCRSPFTRKGYKTALNKFFNFAATNAVGFDPDVAITMKPDKLNPIVLNYAMHLKKVAKATDGFKRGEINVNSVMFYLSPVKGFFDNNELTLAWKKIMRYVPEGTVRHYHTYTLDEIRKMLTVANHRERVIVLVLMTSGIRAQALVQLQLRDLTTLSDGIGRIVVYARTKDFYHSFVTPEGMAAIKFYLDWRKEMGEELKPEGPLIRDSIKDAFAKGTKSPKPISYMRLWEITQKLLRKANISNENVQPNHSFRRCMNTAVANAKINWLFKELMMGHALKLDETYYDREDPNSIENLHQEYVKVVGFLTLNEEHKLRLKVSELEKKDQETEKRIEAAVERKVHELLTRANLPKIMERNESK
jgi:integrase